MKVEHERILIEKEGLLSFFNWRSKALADFNATAANADEVSMTEPSLKERNDVYRLPTHSSTCV